MWSVSCPHTVSMESAPKLLWSGNCSRSRTTLRWGWLGWTSSKWSWRSGTTLGFGGRGLWIGGPVARVWLQCPGHYWSLGGCVTRVLSSGTVWPGRDWSILNTRGTGYFSHLEQEDCGSEELIRKQDWIIACSSGIFIFNEGVVSSSQSERHAVLSYVWWWVPTLELLAFMCQQLECVCVCVCIYLGLVRL